jgi:hypothetical protein
VVREIRLHSTRPEQVDVRLRVATRRVDSKDRLATGASTVNVVAREARAD